MRVVVPVRMPVVMRMVVTMGWGRGGNHAKDVIL